MSSKTLSRAVKVEKEVKKESREKIQPPISLNSFTSTYGWIPAFENQTIAYGQKLQFNIFGGLVNKMSRNATGLNPSFAGTYLWTVNLQVVADVGTSNITVLYFAGQSPAGIRSIDATDEWFTVNLILPLDIGQALNIQLDNSSNNGNTVVTQGHMSLIRLA